MEKDDKHSVTNKRGAAWLALGLICLIVFLLLLDQSALSTELNQESSNYMRQLVMLFILPLVLLAFLVRHYRYRITEFWFRWGVPFSLSAVILILVLPSVLVSLVEYTEINAEANLSLVDLFRLEGADRSEQSETPTQERIAKETSATIPMQKENDDSDKKFYWFAIGFGMALTFAGAVLFRLPRRRFSTDSVEEPVPLQSEVDSSSRIIIKSTQHYCDVVTLTFKQLVQLAGQKSGVTLGQAVTASEFQSTLQRQGFPETALQVITHAFEQVRYGHQEPSREQIIQVELALATIHQHLAMDGEDNE